MMKSVLKYCCIALAACVGSFAFAADVVQHTRLVAAYVTAADTYGGEVAKLHGELAHMANASDAPLCTVANGLVRDSHGYLQASASEVTKGTTGSTVTVLG